MRAAVSTTIRMTTFATPAEGVTLDQLVELLKFRGIEIIRIDRERNHVVIAQEEHKVK